MVTAGKPWQISSSEGALDVVYSCTIGSISFPGECCNTQFSSPTAILHADDNDVWSSRSAARKRPVTGGAPGGVSAR